MAQCPDSCKVSYCGSSETHHCLDCVGYDCYDSDYEGPMYEANMRVRARDGMPAEDSPPPGW
jgi:hypothetical protein